MTNKDNVLAFLQGHPESTQREIVENLNIHPPQQVYNILKNLMQDGYVDRRLSEGVFKYFMLTQGSLDRDNTRTSSSKPRPIAKAQAGMSKEQQEAENWLIERLSEQLGIHLAKKRLYPVGKSWLELDGFYDHPFVICEAWAHIGNPKSAQKNKVMADALKLLYVKDFLKKDGRCILLFGDEQAASHFQHDSWNAKCLGSNGIEVKIITFTPELRRRVINAQERQKR